MLENLQSIATILGICIGGLWAWFNFFQGRVYRTRLEPAISGALMRHDGVSYLIVKAQAHNAGLSKVDIQHKGTGYRVLSVNPEAKTGRTSLVEAVRLRTFRVFADHGWIESGETITEEQLVRISGGGHLAFLLELRIVAHGIDFRTKTVVPALEELTPTNAGHSNGLGES
jgi:hypothetical protein